MIYLQNPRIYYPIPIMWNNNNKYVSEDNEDDDSWEVRAFEEDTAGNLLGCTWPPRSYACTFCRREFRSAQALGGHMNVHRRDRARLNRGPVPLHQPQQIIASTPVDSPEPPSVVFPTGREFIEANALCVLYPIAPDHDAIFVPTHPIDYVPSAALLPIAPFSANNIYPSHTPAGNSSSGTDPPAFNSNNVVGNAEDSSAMEELDLELRLGR